MPVYDAWLKHNVRQVVLGNGLFPSQATAKQYGMPLEELSQTFWRGALGVTASW